MYSLIIIYMSFSFKTLTQKQINGWYCRKYEKSNKKYYIFFGNEIGLQPETLSLMKTMLNSICETMDMKMRTGTNCDVWVVDFHRHCNKT
jgi:hypothetical protein